MTPRCLNGDFRCVHCGNFVSALSMLCGVNNRNHCPYCLYSRHVDLVKPGDRLSACKAQMRPLGLTVKPGRNKYAAATGELMLIHACVDCGSISINRIAADDDVGALLELFASSFALPARVVQSMRKDGILLLGRREFPLVRNQLQGCATPA